MAKKLYVGNLSYTTKDEGLRAAFEEFGVVSASVIVDRASGRSKGFGFVEIEDDAKAAEAIAKWDGKELDGRAVKVNEARPMEERPPRRGGFNRGGFHGGGNRDESY